MGVCCSQASWYLVAVTVTFVVFITPFGKWLRRCLFGKWFVFIESRLAKNMAKSRLVAAKKTELFASMAETVSKVGGPVLEIGVGTGVNLKYYPDKSELIALEPEAGFRPHFETALKQAEHVTLRDFLLGSASDMAKVGTESVACVVSTCVLCMLDRPEDGLKEVLRVLKPGGRFYFLEHVKETEGWVSTLQKFLYFPWYWVSGCHVTHDTGEQIKKAGFAELELDEFCMNVPFWLKVVRTFVYGWGEKR